MGAMALHARHSTEQGRASVHRHPDHLVPIVENQTPNETAPRPWWRQRAWAWMLAAALGVRLVFLAHAALADPLLRVLISDADWYHEHARAIATGESFRPGLPHWLPPLYPWVLSLVYRVTDGALFGTLALQALVGLGVQLSAARLTARVVDERAGLISGWLWTLYAPAWFFESRLLGINAALPLCLVALHAGVRASERLERSESAAMPGLLAGLATGLAALARPNLLLSLPGAGLALLWTRRRAGTAALAPTLLAAAVGLAAGVAPGLASNLERSSLPVLVSANGGINFWFGNNPQAHGTFHAPAAEWGSITDQRDVSVRIAAEQMGRESVDEIEASRWWAARGRAWIADAPADAFELMLLKLADSASSFEFGIQYVFSEVRRQVPSLWLGPLPFGVLLGLAAIGLARGQKVRHRAPLGGWIVAGVGASLLYFTYSRFRLPWLPALLPFCAVGALAVWDALRGRGRLRPLELGLALLLLAQSFVPFEGNYPERLERHAAEDASRAWFDLGRQARASNASKTALARFERAVALDPNAGAAVYELASIRLGAADANLVDANAGLDLLESFSASSSARAVTPASILDDLDVLHAAALIQVPPVDTDDRARARRLVDDVLTRTPDHAGALELARRIP